MSIELRWNLFKPTGKWAYGGTVTISGDNPLWETESLLREIDQNQDQVVHGTILHRNYNLVIQPTETQDKKDYQGFYLHMFPAV